MWERFTIKSCTRETMNLSTWRKTKKRSCVTSHMSSPVTNAKTLLTPPLWTAGWFAKTKRPKKVWKHKKSSNCPEFFFFLFSFTILAIHSLTKSLQLSRFQSLTEGTYIFVVHTEIANSRLNWSRGDSVKIKMQDCKISKRAPHLKVLKLFVINLYSDSKKNLVVTQPWLIQICAPIISTK